MANTAIANDLDQKFFSELVEPLVQPLLMHMVAPFVNGDDKNFSLQIKGKIAWEWKTLEGNLKKLFAAMRHGKPESMCSMERNVLRWSRYFGT